MERQISSSLTPPPTDFPYPEPRLESFNESQVGSDSTLCEVEKQHPHGHKPKESKEEIISRPSLVASKYATEYQPPVAQRHPLPPLQRRSTGGRNLAKATSVACDPRHTSDSSNWSSSDDSSPERLQKIRSLPGHDALFPSKLNQVKRGSKGQFSRNDRSRRFFAGNDHFQTRGRVSHTDGRLNISVNETANSGYLAKALGATIKRHLDPQARHKREAVPVQDREAENHGPKPRIPKLNIVIMVIGSRGDIQPFLKIGKMLKEQYGHRVRIATHPVFKNFVEKDIGLEFFSVGGDPSELMAFMVKNPGLIPSIETVKAGEIGRRRESMYEMFQGFWRACINATDDEKDIANLRMMGDKYPFIADAIIANPPSFAHFHCAERLGVPLHLVFTFPYTPTQAFPHPLANIKTSNVDQNYTNYMSYPLVELMTWQGLGDLVNRFRVKTLGLDEISTLWAAGQLSRLACPTTYLWSPGLVPKPADWGPEIDVAGYVFLDLASSFEPPESLVQFLKTGDKEIVYIGFGSISGIEDPVAFTKLIFEAVEKAGVRALVSKGWGGMGDVPDIPESIYLVDNIPHDWLFPQVDAVIHHGGAGTTAIGLKCGKPGMVVPFFGDQPFWGAMLAKAGAGAKDSWSLKKLTVERFAEGIKQCLEPEAKEKAAELARGIAAEGDGARNMIESFHRSLPLEGEHSMRCSIFEDRVAVWRVKHTKIKLSALAADLLVESKHLRWADLLLQKHYEWNDFQGPGEPITGAGGAFVSSMREAVGGVTRVPATIKEGMRQRDKQKRRKQRKTVADAMLLPGQIAQARENARGEPTLSDDAGNDAGNAPNHLERVNLHGDAEPVKVKKTRRKKGALNPTTECAPNAHIESQAAGGLPTISPSSTNSLPEASSKPATVAKSTAQGLGHTAKALVEMPLDISHALALGFRNAPRLYGDKTVRTPPQRITGLLSGLKAAGSELWLGVFDGVTGLVRIPYHDVKEEGAMGLATGIGRGVGGLVLKPLSGIIGLSAYTGKGVQASLRKRFRDTRKTDRWIRRGRMNQGAKDVHDYLQGPVDRPARQQDDLDQVRTHALTKWEAHMEQQRVKEGREKERKASLMPPRHY